MRNSGLPCSALCGLPALPALPCLPCLPCPACPDLTSSVSGSRRPAWRRCCAASWAGETSPVPSRPPSRSRTMPTRACRTRDAALTRRVSISRSGRYKQRDKRRSGIWDNPKLVDDPAAPPGDCGAPGAPVTPAAPATPSPVPPGDDKENSDAGSVRSKDSVRSRGSSVLLDTSQVAQELLELAEQELTSDQPSGTVIVTNL